MKVSLIKGSDKNALKKINEVLAIYNDDKGLNEGFTNDYPDKATIAYVKGKKGGVLVETIFKGGVFIYYAGFEECDRRKGYLKKCLDAITKSGLTIYGVQLNPFDDLQFWARLGFTNQIMFNWTPTYLNTTPEKLNALMAKHPNNDEF